MPEGFPDPTKVPDDQKRMFLQGLLANPNLLPESFLGYLVDYLAINQPSIPISLIQGYSQTVPTSNTVLTDQTTTSTTYTNLSTTGPEITGLESGEYLCYFGASSGVTTGTTLRNHYMSIDVNSGGASDNDACLWATIASVANFKFPGARAVTKTLTAASNTITCKYRVTGDTATFANRWLIVLRTGNA